MSQNLTLSEWQDNFKWTRDNGGHIEFDELVKAILATGEEKLYFTIAEGFKLYVVVNDVFAWACADLEEVETYDNAANLFYEVTQNEDFGDIVWACIKRKQLPQQKLIDAMMKEPNGVEAMTKIRKALEAKG